MSCRSRLIGSGLIAWLALGAVAAAHEIGTTRVAARFEDGRYAIEIVTDAAALVEKLDAVAGTSMSFPDAARTFMVRDSTKSGDARALQETLAARDEVFRQRIAVAFDSAVARPEIHYTVSPAPDVGSSPLATIGLTGDIPPSARDFTWSYAWTFASYTLSLTRGASQPTTQQLEGGQPSAPVSLAAPPSALSRASIAWGYLSIFFAAVALRVRGRNRLGAPPSSL